MTLPARRKRVRSGIERVPERRYPAHLRFVRRFVCCVPRCPHEMTIAAHVRTETDGGEAMKPSDWWTISLCERCHYRQHHFSERAFEAETGIDMKAKATEFARKSPVPGVRAMAGVRL